MLLSTSLCRLQIKPCFRLFDPRGGSAVVREKSIETDEHTSSFGGCWS